MVKLLFICMANSCRSQMAEGLARYYGDGWLDVYSAGLQPCPIDPRAVQVLAERGIDIGRQVHKSLGEVPLTDMAMIIVLSRSVAGKLPPLPVQAHRLHWEIADPTSAQGSDEHVMGLYRKVCTELEGRIQSLLPVIEKLPRIASAG